MLGLSSLIIGVGVLLLVIGIVIRRFWPHSKGTFDFGFLELETPEWLAFMLFGIMFLAVGIFLIIAAPYL